MAQLGRFRNGKFNSFFKKHINLKTEAQNKNLLKITKEKRLLIILAFWKDAYRLILSQSVITLHLPSGHRILDGSQTRPYFLTTSMKDRSGSEL